MILSQFLSSYYSNTTSSSSPNVMAKVAKTMQAQNTAAPALNAALASDNTTLSGLGKLMSALTSFQSAAQSLSGKAVALPGAAQDPKQLAQKVTDLISQYNALNTTINGLRKGDLKSDASVLAIQSQLAKVFNSSSSGRADASSLTPGSIGISTLKNGAYAVDATKLQKAIAANPGGVAKLFANGGKGIADNLVSQIQGLVSPTGSIKKETVAINKDIASLNAKKDSLAKALTAQANALAKLYSQQNAQGSSTGNISLFDMLT